jgi:hypothetical protein
MDLAMILFILALVLLLPLAFVLASIEEFLSCEELNDMGIRLEHS